MRSHLTRGLLLALLAFLAAGPLLTGCGGGDDANAADKKAPETRQAADTESGDGGDGEAAADGEKKKDGEPAEEAVPVEVVALERGRIESVLRFSTNLEAESAVQVISEAARQVVELKVEEGDHVRRGDVLLRLQDEEQRLNLEKARSQLENAEREFERQKRLHEQNLISEQTFNDSAYETDQLRIALEDAELQLSYAEVRAPISGTITTRHVNLGDHVSIGMPLFDMVDFDSIVARVFVPEKNLADLRVGLPARVKADASRASDYECRVKRIAPVVDPKSGTVKVTVDVGHREGLRPGMYVDVDLVVAANEQAVRVPKRALVYDNDQVFVYRLGTQDRVERVFIEPRLSDKYWVEPNTGLIQGDRVVVAGQAGLKDGALVELADHENGAKNDKNETEVAGELPPVERASR